MLIILIFLIIIFIILFYKKNNKRLKTHFIKKSTNNKIKIQNLFESVKIYRFGINTKINLNKCIQILNYIITISNDEVDKQKAIMILNDIQNEIIQPEIIQNEIIINNKWFWPHKSGKNKNFSYYERVINNETVINNNTITEEDIKLQTILLENLKVNNKNINVFDKPIISNDKQNVHDHIVVKSVAQSLNNLNDISTNDNIEITTEFINFKNNLDDSTKLTLSKILSNVEKISSYNLSEYEIFVKVWKIIINHNNKNELLNILKFQLIDSNNMCSMGRANRIIQTLEGFDNNITIKPEWAILIEMNNIASKTFNDLLENKLYSNIIESEDEKLINDFKNTYKNLLLSKFNIYNNLLSSEYINAKINEYLQVI